MRSKRKRAGARASCGGRRERATGRLGTQTHAAKKARIGYDYIHAAVDDHSRLAYAEILPDEKGPTAAGFLLRAAAHFTAHGIPAIEAS